MFIRILISLIGGTAAFYFLGSIISGFFLKFLISILSYYIIYKILKTLMKDKDKPGSELPRFKDIQAEKTVKDGIERLRALRNRTMMIQNNSVAGEVKDICKTGMEIFEYIMKNPDDIKKARQFINYYLDTTEKIVNQYIELSGRKEITPEVSVTLEKVETLLNSIQETYKKQLKNLLEDDLLDLNVEIQVLEKTMRLEG